MEKIHGFNYRWCPDLILREISESDLRLIIHTIKLMIPAVHQLEINLTLYFGGH